MQQANKRYGVSANNGQVACSPTDIVPSSVSTSRLREVLKELLEELLAILNNVRFVFKIG
jgi:hypothetical protein